MRKLWLLVGEGLLALMLCVPHTGLTQPASDELHKLQQDMEAMILSCAIEQKLI